MNFTEVKQTMVGTKTQSSVWYGGIGDWSCRWV